MAQQNPYAQDVEMHAYPAHNPIIALPLPDFLTRVQNTRVQLRTLTTEIQRLTTLHQRALSSATPDAVQQETDAVHASAQNSTRLIRESIQNLKEDTENTPETGAGNSLFQQKRAHVETLAREFQGLVRKFLDGERAYKARRRDAIVRQYRVVNPDADEAELREVVEGNGNVFQNAVCSFRSSKLPLLNVAHAPCDVVMSDMGVNSEASHADSSKLAPRGPNLPGHVSSRRSAGTPKRTTAA